MWKLGWKPLLGVAVLLVVMGPIVVDGWDEWLESGQGSNRARCCTNTMANGSSVLVLVHGLWAGAAGPAWLVLEGRQSRLLSLISKLHRWVSAFVL